MKLQYVLAVKDPVMNRLCVQCKHEELHSTNFMWFNVAIIVK